MKKHSIFGMRRREIKLVKQRYGSVVTRSASGPGVSARVLGAEKLIKVLKEIPDDMIKKPQMIKASMRKGFGITEREARRRAKAISTRPARITDYMKTVPVPDPRPVRMWTDKDATVGKPGFHIGAIRSYFHLNILEGYYQRKGPYAMPKPTVGGKKRGWEKDYKLSFIGTNQHAGKRIVTPRVENHPGPQIRPWLRQALYSTEEKVVKKTLESIRAAIDKALTRKGV